MRKATALGFIMSALLSPAWPFDASAAQLLPLAGPPSVQIGAFDSPDNEVFGRIQDVAMGPEGSFFVLDDLVRDVRWFDPSGGFVARIGREGQGPGELGAPSALAVDDAGDVHVLDAQNRRITIFSTRAGQLRYSRDHLVPFGTDLCIAGSRRFIVLPSALGGGHLVHEIEEEGSTLQSFAPPVPLDQAMRRGLERDVPVVEEIYERGLLVCDAASGTLILVGRATPSVRAFSLSGEQLWAAELADYHVVRYGPGPRGGLAQIPDPESGTAHSTSGAFIDGEYLYVSLYEGGINLPEGRLEVRVLRRSDGTEVGRQPTPMRLVAQGRGLVLGRTSDPFPQVAAYPIRE
jgi:hypothetical protein